MENNVNAVLFVPDRIQIIQKQVFDSLDVSENTRMDYSVRIGQFLNFVQLHGFNHNTFLEYKRYLMSVDTFSVSTKNKYLVSAKVFLDGFFRFQLIPVKLTDNIKGFTQSKLHQKDGLNDEAILILQTYCNELEPTITNLRLKAILLLLIFQGLRQIEISRLNVTDIELKTKVAFIRGKGRDDKEPIHLHPSTVNILKYYLTKCRFKEGALFRSSSNFSNGSRLTT